MSAASGSNMTIDYKLFDAGWAEASFSSSSKSHMVVVSYIHDSLRDLAKAAIVLGDEAETVTVIFLDEPGEHQLILDRLSGNNLNVSIRCFEDWTTGVPFPETEFTTVFEATTTISLFRSEVARVLTSLLEEHGEAGYREKWVLYDFPMAEYRRLLA